ncbi:MAG: AAA family ATPase [Chloroflexi bacterium]|nr:AAA family ATPase [Chloroflexota bacterium]
MSKLALHLLGSPYIERDDILVSVDTRKALALIAYLAVNSGYQSRDTLAALLWSDSDQTASRGALRRTLSVLNTALGGVGLEIEREAIAFKPEIIWCDWNGLHQYMQACQTHGHAARQVCDRCLDPLTQAAALWTGEFMQGFSLRDSVEFDQWQSQQAEHTRRVYAGVLQRLVQLQSDNGNYERALETALDWLALDPLNEAAHRHLIQLFAWTGQREVAIRQYRECVRILDQELGTPPLEETSALYKLVLEDKLETPTPKIVTAANLTQTESLVSSQLLLPLVGRGEALNQILAAYDAVERGNLTEQIVCIEGEAGIGKTRLVNTVLAEKSTGSHLVIRCYESEIDLAYAPIIRTLRAGLDQSDWLSKLTTPWLNELVRLLPEIVTHCPDVIYPPVLDNVAAQSRLVEAIAQALDVVMASEQPALLVVEDLQWVDQATLDFLAYYLRRKPRQIALCILTWRPERSDSLDRLPAILAEYERAGGALEVVHLGRLDMNDVNVLARHAGITDVRLIERLYSESEGLPFFLAELFPLVNSQMLSADIDNLWSLPHSIESLLRARLTSIGESLRQLLGAASVLGRTFDDALLQACSGRSESEVVDGLDALLAHGLLVTKTGEFSLSYDFFHDMLRRLVYEDLNSARRRLLHKRAATVLLRRIGHPMKSSAQPSALSGEVARHLEMSGQESEAARYYFDAGLYARHLFANHEAIHHFQMALAMAHPEVAHIYQQLGDVYLLIGDLGMAIQSYETALAHSTDELIGALEHAVGCVYHRMGEWDLAQQHFQRALDSLPDSQAAEQVTTLVDWSLTAYNCRALDRAEALAESALTLSLQQNDAQTLAQCHNILGILARHRGDLAAAQEHHELSLGIATDLGIVSMEVAIYNNLALTFIAGDQFSSAESMLQRAVILCEQQGDRHRAAALHNNLADLYHQIGQNADTMAHLKQAVALFAEIGATIQTHNPEIWRLSEW